jgi:hypothetical protein
VFELYYTYGGVDYKVFPLDVTEGIGWKNIQGFPCNTISLVESETTPSVGRYRISYDEASVSVYNSLIEDCTLNNPNRSSDQRVCYENVREFNSVLITCINIPEITFSYNNEVDNLEGNANEGIIPGLSIVLNEFTVWPNIFDVFYGGFFIEEEERYLIPLDFGYLLKGETGEVKTFTIKAVGALTNCFMEIVDKDGSEGSNIWNMGVDDNWYQGNSQVDIGNFLNNDMLDIQLRCNVPLGWTEEITEGYLQLTADEGTLLIPLVVGFMTSEAVMDGEVVTDGDLFLRCVVLSQNNADILASFGITEAS